MALSIGRRSRGASCVAQKERCWSLRGVKANERGEILRKKKKYKYGTKKQPRPGCPPGHWAEAVSVTSARPVSTPCPASGRQQQQSRFDFFFLFRNGLLSDPTYAFSAGLTEGKMRASTGNFLTSVNFPPDLAVSQRDVLRTRGKTRSASQLPSSSSEHQEKPAE